MIIFYDTRRTVTSLLMSDLSTTNICTFLNTLIDQDLFPGGEGSVVGDTLDQQVWQFQSPLYNLNVDQISGKRQYLNTLIAACYEDYSYLVGLRTFSAGTKSHGGASDSRTNYLSSCNFATPTDRYALQSAIDGTDDETKRCEIIGVLIDLKIKKSVKLAVDYHKLMDKVVTSICKGEEPLQHTFDSSSKMYTLRIKLTNVDYDRLSTVHLHLTNNHINTNGNYGSLIHGHASQSRKFSVGLYIGPETFYDLTEKNTIFGLPVTSIFKDYSLQDRFLKLREWYRRCPYFIQNRVIPEFEKPYEYAAQYDPQRWILHVDVSDVDVLTNFYRLHPHYMLNHIWTVLSGLTLVTGPLTSVTLISPPSSNFEEEYEEDYDEDDNTPSPRSRTRSPSPTLPAPEVGTSPVVPPVPVTDEATTLPDSSSSPLPVSDTSSSPLPATDTSSSPLPATDTSSSPLPATDEVTTFANSADMSPLPQSIQNTNYPIRWSIKSMGHIESQIIDSDIIRDACVSALQDSVYNHQLTAINNCDSKTITVTAIIKPLVALKVIVPIVEAKTDTVPVEIKSIDNIYTLCKDLAKSLKFPPSIGTRLLSVFSGIQVPKHMSTVIIKDTINKRCKDILEPLSGDVDLLSSDRIVSSNRLKTLLSPLLIEIQKLTGQ